ASVFLYQGKKMKWGLGQSPILMITHYKPYRAIIMSITRCAIEEHSIRYMLVFIPVKFMLDVIGHCV
ncbi:hypothetical protein, partial [Carboxylicivirga linearis]